MKIVLMIQSMLLAAALSYSSLTFADNRDKIEPKGFIYGFGLGVNQEVYKDYDMRIIPIPVIGYRGDAVNIFGPFVSYKIADFDGLKFSIKLAPRFAGYDEDDSDVFKGMDTRKSSLDGGIGVDYKYNNLRIDSSLMFDLLGNSNGYESSSNLSYVWRLGAFFIEPSVGLKYQDSDLVNYYYGVRAHEASATRTQYSPDYAFNSSIGISATTMRILNGLTRIGVTKTWYGNAITDSPLVEIDSTSGLSFFLSYSRFF
ncbi:MipA/OmpV family protein [Psychromonas antarctica]|uniref:MipA/OmpV family protein n=1 Tax=Psychromonas antarctica TaxID=67573 RepID=UPI001EE95D67|nr:MipA/OmpV family protein [Psychromonas antarctica]MCG6200826.1 MipA/OmpV family protein [Psychromonas antarctica]